MYPFGAHVAVVEVDRETGRVELRDFVSVDDCGTRVSPLLVDGQVHGGIAEVASAAGTGSTFSLTLPQGPPAGKPVAD